MLRALGLAAVLLLAAPLAQAKNECQLEMGHGWPPATQNHGSAVEQLFAGSDQPVLSLTRLPLRGKESGVMLLHPAGSSSWTLRSAVADERVANVVVNARGVNRTLRVDQTPKLREIPMPAALAERLVDSWQRALQAAVPAGREARFHEDELLVFTLDGQRVVGLEPGCGPARLLVRQSQLLIEAAGSKEKHRTKQWRALMRSLDELQEQLADAG